MLQVRLTLSMKVNDGSSDRLQIEVSRKEMSKWDDARKSSLDQIQRLEINLLTEYKWLKRWSLIKLFEYLKNVKTIHLTNIYCDANFDGFLSAVKDRMKAMPALRLTEYGAATKESIHNYLPAKRVYAEDTDATVLEGFTDIEIFVISITSSRLDGLPNHSFASRIWATKGTLRELYIIASLKLRCQYFIDIFISAVDIDLPQIEEINVEWNVKGAKVNVVLKRTSDNVKHRHLIVGQLADVTEARGMINIHQMDQLTIPVTINRDIPTLSGVLSGWPNYPKLVELSTGRRAEVSRFVISGLYGRIGAIPRISLRERDDGDSVDIFHDTTPTKMVANIKSGRHFAKLFLYQVIH